MNTTETVLSSRQPEEVEIGDFTIWCEYLKAQRKRVFTEKPSVTGADVITSSFPKEMLITLSGRICQPDAPLAFVESVSAMMQAGTAFDVEYRGLTFADCRVESFSAEDKGEEHIYSTLTLISAGIRNSEVTE